ncbi:MAG: ABC transporter ATP-binding protein [Faecousia sp.]
MENIIEVRNLTKKYGDFTANKNINFSIRRGEIHAIIGENGAGKTTLMNMLFGIIQPTSGEILFNGQPVKLSSPKDAIAHGIGMVHQHFKLASSLTIYENVLLGDEIHKDIPIGKKKLKSPIIDKQKEIEAVQTVVDRFGFNLIVTEKVQDISVGCRQRVEIVKMLYHDADVLILDEPTAVLVPQEIDELLHRLNELRDMGKTIIIITHKLEEVKLCADRITVIRRGEVVGTVNNDDKATAQLLANMMVGRPVLLTAQRSTKPIGEKVLLSVRNLSAKNSAGKYVLKDISFDIHEGEILGIAGVDGNGQTELMFQLTGLMEAEQGSVILDGEEIFGFWPDALRSRGVGIIPEDRYRQGVCLSVPVSQNLVAGYHGREPFCKGFRMNYKEVNKYYKQLAREYDIRVSDDDPPVGSLSGGNAQKVIVAREFSQNPKLLYASQPTRGIDVGATEFIHHRLIRSRDEGKAILLISSELSEVVGLSDRVVVMYEGEITGEFNSSDVTFEELGLYMSGAKRQNRKGGCPDGQETSADK